MADSNGTEPSRNVVSINIQDLRHDDIYHVQSFALLFSRCNSMFKEIGKLRGEKGELEATISSLQSKK